MARTVRDAFNVLLERIEPVPSEVAAAKRHASTIAQGLSAEFPKLVRLEIMGSHTRETAIRTFSDVDYLAVLGVQEVRWGDGWVSSSTTLARVKKAMVARFPGTEVWTDAQAIVVGFGQGASAVDVVPGVWIGTTKIDGYPAFAIPDGAGGWLNTSPQRHSKYIREQHEVRGNRLAALVRLMKRWKYSRDPAIPLLGFHLELLLASSDIGTSVGRSHRECLLDAFRLLRNRQGAALNDPLGISGRIPAVSTEAKAAELVRHASYAADHADRALDAEVAGDIDEAFRQWNIVFNGHFPVRR